MQKGQASTTTGGLSSGHGGLGGGLGGGGDIMKEIE